MGFKVAVVYFSLRGRLATLAHVVAEGARTVEGAEVTVYRIRDPVRGDDPTTFDAGVLAAPVATKEVVAEADCVVVGAPGRQGGIAGEVRLFLDDLADLQMCAAQGSTSKLMVRVERVAVAGRDGERRKTLVRQGPGHSGLTRFAPTPSPQRRGRWALASRAWVARGVALAATKLSSSSSTQPSCSTAWCAPPYTACLAPRPPLLSSALPTHR